VFRTGGSPAGYLQVQDNGQSAGGAKEARIFGYETMSAYNTGTGLYPTNAQRANGYCIRKSNTADSSNARAWYLAATNETFYLAVETGDTASAPCWAGYGRFKSYKANDQYNFFISGRITENSATVAYGTDCFYARVSTLGNLANTNPFTICRSYTGTGSAIYGNFISDGSKATGAIYGAGTVGITYPAVADGGLYMSKTEVWEVAASALRGELPGIWVPLHNKPLTHLDTFTGVSGLTGRSFLVLNAGSLGQIFLETSDTWDV
jgi:hypothetical protein